MNFFQQYRAKQAKEIEPPPVQSPPLPNEEAIKTIDTVKPIHVDDAQYLLLTRALRPGIVTIGEDREADVPGPNIRAVAGKVSEPPAVIPGIISPDQPPGTPIV